MLTRVNHNLSVGKGLSQNSLPRYPAAGSVLALACGNGYSLGGTQTYFDALGQQWDGYSLDIWVEKADGQGGSSGWFLSNPLYLGIIPCSYPYGFIISGYDTTYSLLWSWDDQTNVSINFAYAYDVHMSDGAGGSYHYQDSAEYYATGDIIGYTTNGIVLYQSYGSTYFFYNYGYILDSYPSHDDFNVGCGVQGYTSYYDVVTRADGAGGSYITNDNQRYETMGASYGTCDYNLNRYVNVGCGDWRIGSYYNENIADGNGGYTYNFIGDNYYPWGTYIGTCGSQYSTDYDYYSDGGGGYYANPTPPPCPPYGSFAYNDSGNNLVTISGTQYIIGSYNYDYWNDGYCGYYYTGSGSSYPYGQFITSVLFTDNNGTNIMLYYYSDGNYGVYYSLS